MTIAQQTADSAAQRDLTDVVAAREKAAEYIRKYVREHDGELPSGEAVGDHCGMTGRWGQKQLSPFRDDLVAERSGGAGDSSPATAVIGTAGPERPPRRSAAGPPERPAPPALARPERSATATGGASGTTSGTTRTRSGTPTTAPRGTFRAGGRSRKLRELVDLLPLLAIAGGAFVSIWGGWVGLGKLTGFGPIELLPGIAPGWKFDTAITLPLGMEAYAAYALKVWMAPPRGLSDFGKAFARRSAIAALCLGALGQIAYHVMAAAGVEHAPWPITMFVACLPVGVLGCGAALVHLVRHPEGRS